MYAAKSLAETGITPFCLADTREEAARKALRRAGRSYIVTYRLVPTMQPAEHELRDKRVYHPDDLQLSDDAGRRA